MDGPGRGRCVMVRPLPSKQETRVRFPPPAPSFRVMIRAKLGIEVIPVDSAEVAVKGCDILSTCTDGMTPV